VGRGVDQHPVAVGGDQGQEGLVALPADDGPEQPAGLGCPQEHLEGLDQRQPGVVELGHQRLVDHGQEPVGLRRHVGPGHPVPGAELVVEGLATDLGGPGHVSHADLRPWSVDQEGAHAGIEKGPPALGPQRLGAHPVRSRRVRSRPDGSSFFRFRGR
jgi:hypothetical protein